VGENATVAAGRPRGFWGASADDAALAGFDEFQ
jgi:hypothetical protein